MILLGLGANLPSPVHGAPRETLSAALSALRARGIRVERRSSWYETAPVPVSAQPWFVNAVALLRTGLGPRALLAELLALETAMGRQRGERWSARTIDLDLLAYNDCVCGGADSADETATLILPHPRLQARAFVLRPLAELAPDWRHPVSGRTATELLAALPPGQTVNRLAES